MYCKNWAGTKACIPPGIELITRALYDRVLHTLIRATELSEAELYWAGWVTRPLLKQASVIGKHPSQQSTVWIDPVVCKAPDGNQRCYSIDFIVLVPLSVCLAGACGKVLPSN